MPLLQWIIFPSSAPSPWEHGTLPLSEWMAWPSKASRLCPDHLLGLSRVSCSAQKQDKAEQRSASAVPPVMSSRLDLHCLLQRQNMLRCERNTVRAGSCCLAVFVWGSSSCRGWNDTLLFFFSLLRPLVSSHESGKGHTTKKQRECVHNSWTLHSRNSFGSNPSSSGNDKKLAQPEPEPQDQEMSRSDLRCLLSPVVPLRQLLNIVRLEFPGTGPD